MESELIDFKEFMKQREGASQAFVNGNVQPLEELSTAASPATIFGPMGDCVEGAENVNAANARSAKFFEPGSSTSLEIRQMAASGGIAFWAGIQRATVRMPGNPESVPMNLRVTEVFRREAGTWRLVHRHADLLKND